MKRRRGIFPSVVGIVLAATLATAPLTGALPFAFAVEPTVGPEGSFGGDLTQGTASTDVTILVNRVPFAIVDITEDFAGPEAEVRAQTLKVVAQGEGALTCTWTRTVDGTPDPAFTATGFEHPLAADSISNEHRYRYTATVHEGYSDQRLAASIDVLASAYHAWRTLTSIAGVSVSGYIRTEARLTVQPLGEVDPRRMAFEQAAGIRIIDSAYEIRLECPGGLDPYVGEVSVAIRYADAARIAETGSVGSGADADATPAAAGVASAVAATGKDLAGDARSSRETDAGSAQGAGSVEVLWYSPDDATIHSIAGVDEGDLVRFKTGELGAFAVLSDRVLTRTITATSSPGGSIEPAGNVEVPVNASQTFVFEADGGYKLERVQVDGQEVAPTGASYTVPASAADQTIHVDFKAVEGRDLTALVTSGDSHGPLVALCAAGAMTAAMTLLGLSRARRNAQETDNRRER